MDLDGDQEVEPFIENAVVLVRGTQGSGSVFKVTSSKTDATTASTVHARATEDHLIRIQGRAKEQANQKTGDGNECVWMRLHPDNCRKG